VINTPTLKTTIENALELSQIIINILYAAHIGEITAAEAKELIDNLIAA
jgi:hypothetical protein